MNSPPVLCSVTQQPGHGGIARVSALLWRVLEEMSARGCRLITLIPQGFEPPNAMDKLRFVKKVTRELLWRNVDWIVFDHLNLARVQRVVPRPFRRPYAVLLYGAEAWSPLSPRLKRVVQEATVRIAISKYTAERVAAAHRDIGPVEVCHLALPAPQWRRKVPGSPGESLKYSNVDASLLERVRPNSVLIVGRMFRTERYKGHDFLLEAWPSLKAGVPDAQLVIVGRGDDMERLSVKARNTGLGDSILFTGQVNDGTLEGIYRRAAVFAMPSRGEGFGLVYLEAMQHRLPCVGSIHDAAAEVVEHGVTGWLVNQDDKAGLVEALAGLLQNPSRRREMGEAGFERLQKLFSFEQFRGRILRALKPLMSSGVFSV